MRSFASFLICLIGALISTGNLDCARAAATHFVFAHYMVCNPTYGASVQGFEHDIQDAQAAGIDGFALDLGAYNDPNQSYYNVNVAYMYAAAEALGTGFKLFFSVRIYKYRQYCAVDQHLRRPPQYVHGRDQRGLSTLSNGVDWENGVFAPLSQSGISVFFVPFFCPTPPKELPTYSQGVDLLIPIPTC